MFFTLMAGKSLNPSLRLAKMTSTMYWTRCSIWASWRMLRRRSKIAKIIKQSKKSINNIIYSYIYCFIKSTFAWATSATNSEFMTFENLDKSSYCFSTTVLVLSLRLPKNSPDFLIGEPIVLLTTVHDNIIYLRNTIRHQ